MNVKNLVKQCEMVMMLSNGATNNELNLVYNTAKDMVAKDMGKLNHLVFRKTPTDVNLTEVCNFMRNLRMWQFMVVGDMKEQFEWQKVAKPREIVQLGKEFAMKYRL